MRTINKSYKAVITLLLCLFTTGLFFQSCKEDKEEFRLDAFGPSKVERGGEIYFVGSGMDQVESITLPADNGSWIFTKGDFTVESGKITLTIPPDYPLDQQGNIILTLSNGSTFTTSSWFMVLSEVSITSVENIGTKDQPLRDYEIITIKGKTLSAVGAIVFSNGLVLTEFEERTDKEIKFKLPVDASSGLFKLIEPGRWAEAEDKYHDGAEIFVLEPIIKLVNEENSIEIPPGTTVSFTGQYFERIDVVEGVVNVAFPGGRNGTGTLANGVLTIEIPLGVLAGKSHSITVLSKGKPVVSDAKFTVEKTKFIRYDGNPNPVPRPGESVTIIGENLHAVEYMRAIDTTNVEADLLVCTIISKTPTELIFRLPPRGYDADKHLPRLTLYSGELIDLPKVEIE